jgi:hypothetical protein
MERISIDLDNTIACYDHVFSNIAVKLGYIDEEVSMSKEDIKEDMFTRLGESSWQKLQGKVYGKYMMAAEIFPGFMEFLYLSIIRGLDIDIVSHKTEFGHFDEEKISLREKARQWLQAKGIVGAGDLAVDIDRVFFGDTRAVKIKRINDIDSSVLIDDLPEVLEDSLLYSGIERIFFNPKSDKTNFKGFSAKSWREITRHIIGDWTEDDIRLVLNKKFPELGIRNVSKIKGRANSEVFRLDGRHAGQFFLKIYPDLQLDARTRLHNEVSAINLLSNNDFPVPRHIDNDTDLNWAVFEYIDGIKVAHTDPDFIDESWDFISDLNEKFPYFQYKDKFDFASEACICGDNLIQQINSRLQLFDKSENSQLKAFIKDEFLPEFMTYKSSTVPRNRFLFETPLQESNYILSPSDFGSHNALRNQRGEIVYFDFEYFGWDDPVKLISDFLWHPGMEISIEQKQKWLEKAAVLFKHDSGFIQRLNCYMPLFAFKWCLILLNEFIPENIHQKVRTGAYSSQEIETVLFAQLTKSKILLQDINSISKVYGSALKRT